MTAREVERRVRRHRARCSARRAASRRTSPIRGRAASSVMSLAFLVLLLVGIVFAIAAKDARKDDEDLNFTTQGPAGTPPTPGSASAPTDPLDSINQQILGSAAGSAAATGSASAPEPNVFFSDPIQLDGGENIELEFTAPQLEQQLGLRRRRSGRAGHGQGRQPRGQPRVLLRRRRRRQRGRRARATTDVFVGPRPAGSYVLRFEGQAGPLHDGACSRRAARRACSAAAICCLAVLVLGIPLGLVGLVSYFHEKRRWENSTPGKPPSRRSRSSCSCSRACSW